MKKTAALTALLFSLLIISSSFLPVQAQPNKAVKKPDVAITSVSNSAFSGYNITAETSEGGRVTFLFVWQRKISWNFLGFSGNVTFNTPPILQMSKYFENNTLDHSITYIPLFLIQYNDTNGNGVFDLRTKQKHSEEFFDDPTKWLEEQDKIYRVYSLAPIFYLNRQNAWNWTVTQLKSENVTIDDTQFPIYSWNISAVVPSIQWWRNWLFGTTMVNVSYGFHLRLLPENPEVKYDFKFSGIEWVNSENSTKLAMMSAILYHSSKPPVVRIGIHRYFEFSDIITISVNIKKFVIAENVTDTIEAYVSYSPNATIDGVETKDIVQTALHPLFLIPVPGISVEAVPAGVYVKGTSPGIMGKYTWKHYLAFSHQLGLPHFKETIKQDPLISISADLSTDSLPLQTGSTLQSKALLVLAAASTILIVVYILKRR